MENLVGNIYGDFEVLSLSRKVGHKSYWKCLCSCGELSEFRGDRLKTEPLHLLRCDKCKKNSEQEEFIRISKQNHKFEYDYSNIEYVNKTTDISVYCNLHGHFSVKPWRHQKGDSGCRTCESLDYFFKKAREVHGDSYDYSLVEKDYSNGLSYVKLICRHGEFTMKAATHLAGFGCLKCSYHLDSEKFAKKAFLKHGDKYDYSLVDYNGAHSKVSIICKEHGVFNQSPNSHFNGAGCPTCAYAFNSYDFVTRYTMLPDEGKKVGYLYVMRVTGESESFLKVGISSEMRKRINAYRRDRNYQFELLRYWQTTRLISAIIEADVLEWKKSEKLHYWPRNNFDGRSECLVTSASDALISLIETKIRDQDESRLTGTV